MQQLRTGELISEQYKILSLIGRGGWGDVFKAENVSLGKTVAIKILHAYLSDNQEKLERFRREARLASMIKHPYICPVFDFGVTRAGETYYVMDLVEDRTLEAILDEEKKLPVERAVPLFAKLCEVLSVAHQQGILHRDLKPSNIIISTLSMSHARSVRNSFVRFGCVQVDATAESGTTGVDQHRYYG